MSRSLEKPSDVFISFYKGGCERSEPWSERERKVTPTGDITEPQSTGTSDGENKKPGDRRLWQDQTTENWVRGLEDWKTGRWQRTGKQPLDCSQSMSWAACLVSFGIKMMNDWKYSRCKSSIFFFPPAAQLRKSFRVHQLQRRGVRWKLKLPLPLCLFSFLK